MEIVVDCYDEYERASGWLSYLVDSLDCPFKAKCIRKIQTSPLKENEEVVVTSVSTGDICEHDMYVDIEYKGNSLAVPLYQLEAVSADDKTRQALNDWHYWVDKGYSF